MGMDLYNECRSAIHTVTFSKSYSFSLAMKSFPFVV